VNRREKCHLPRNHHTSGRGVVKVGKTDSFVPFNMHDLRDGFFMVLFHLCPSDPLIYRANTLVIQIQGYFDIK
jgi:hypothetical protein